MSGHSKWSKIKRDKGANDLKRGARFTKLAKEITLAAQQGGGDINSNFSLRVAVDRAKAESLPSLNIERAIKKGTGELKSDNPIVSITYEGYGPAQVAMLIVCKTDNTNRAITEVRQIMDRNGGKISEGSVLWQFMERGMITLGASRFIPSNKFGKDGEYVPTDTDELVLELMELPGVLDVSTYIDDEEDIRIEVLCERSMFSTLHHELEEKNFQIIEAELGFVPQKLVKIDEESKASLENLLELLDDCEDVDSVWHNADI